MARTDVSTAMRADNKKLGGDLAKSRSMFKSTFRGIGRGIKRGLGGVLSPLGVGLGAIGLGAIGKDVVAFENTLQRLTDQAGVTAPAAIDKVRQSMIALSKDTGISRQEVAAAQKELVDLIGPTGLSAAKLQLLADANLATGASMKDLAGLSFVLEKALDLDTPEKLRLGLSAIATAGQFGSISMGEMVPVMKQVASSMKKLTGGGVGGTAELAAALQLLIGEGFANAAEAGTGLAGVLGALAKKQKELGKFGINVTKVENGREVFLGLRNILKQIEFSELGRSSAKLMKTLGRKEPAKAIEALIKNFKQLETDQARAAKQTLKNNSIDIRLANRRNSKVFRLQKSLNNVKESIAKAFTPERIEKFAALMEKLAQFTGFIADNLVLAGTAIAAFKISAFVAGMQAAAAASAATATGATATAAATGTASIAARQFALAMGAAQVAAAAFVGFKIGQQLDDWLGLSTKIANVLSGVEEDVGTGAALRGNIASLNRAGAGFGGGFGGQGAKREGRKLQGSQDILRTARAAVFQGREQGAIVDNKVNLLGLGLGGETQAFLGGGGLGPGRNFGPAAADDPEAAGLRKALAIVAQANKLQEEGIKVTVVVDTQGNFVVKGQETDAARRSPR